MSMGLGKSRRHPVGRVSVRVGESGIVSRGRRDGGSRAAWAQGAGAMATGFPQRGHSAHRAIRSRDAGYGRQLLARFGSALTTATEVNYVFFISLPEDKDGPM